MNIKDIKKYLGPAFDVLVILDLIIIIISLPIRGLHLVDYAGFIKYFDLTICALLLINFSMVYIKQKPRPNISRNTF